MPRASNGYSGSCNSTLPHELWALSFRQSLPSLTISLGMCPPRFSMLTWKPPVTFIRPPHCRHFARANVAVLSKLRTSSTPSSNLMTSTAISRRQAAQCSAHVTPATKECTRVGGIS